MRKGDSFHIIHSPYYYILRLKYSIHKGYIHMTTQKTQFTYNKADNTIAAFDEWLADQSEAVRDTVQIHIAALVKAIPNLGYKSAKILLSEVYLEARLHIHIEKKYGEREL